MTVSDLAVGARFYLVERTMPDGRYPTRCPLILRKKRRKFMCEADQGPDATGAPGQKWHVRADAPVIVVGENE